MCISRLAQSCVLLGVSSALYADVTPITPDYFSTGAEVITFSEVPLRTEVPFQIGSARFGGLRGFVTDAPDGLPPSDSGAPYLYTRSVGNDDTIEISFDSPKTAAGAYFNLEGARQNAVVDLEFYRGDDLVGTLPAIGFEGFLGGHADGASFDRIVFRDVDYANSISFRIDDLMLVPSPGTAAPLCLALLGAATHRRRGQSARHHAVR
ncbi:MAG TPA: hypothetical protein VFF69_12430 [Phycisphaerales bacterium]|nr:hypothetical protein [Phycisphaerales bacterium]